MLLAKSYCESKQWEKAVETLERNDGGDVWQLGDSSEESSMIASSFGANSNQLEYLASI